jgi:hypothetical protein
MSDRNASEEVFLAVNRLLHEAIDPHIEPCATACTHVVNGWWTALGVANVIRRAEQASNHA